MNLTVTIDSDAAQAAVARLGGAFTDARKSELHSEMAMGVETLLIKHMRSTVATKPNRLGAPSTGWWQKAMASVNVTADSSAGTVHIPWRGVALQYFGGVVRPVNKRALTIPIAAVAHGKTVGDFTNAGSGVFKVKGDSSDPETIGILARKRPDKSIEPLFVLRSSVRIAPHPEVLPEESAMVDAARNAANAWIERQVQ